MEYAQQIIYMGFYYLPTHRVFAFIAYWFIGIYGTWFIRFTFILKIDREEE